LTNHYSKVSTLLINPDIELTSYIPLGLVSLLGYSQKLGFDVEIFSFQGHTDDEFFAKLMERSWSLVGFTGLISHYKDLKIRTKQVRDYCPDALVIIGGALANVMPAYLIDQLDIDLAICGEGEVPFLQILNMLSQNNKSYANISGAVYKTNGGKVVMNKKSPVLPLDKLPLLPEHGFDVEPYISHPLGRSVNVQLSRGCPNSCSFCDNSLYPKRIRRRSRQNIMNEITRIYDQSKFDYIYLDDLNPFLSRGLIKDFCETIIELNLPIKWYGNGYAQVMESFDLDLLRGGNCGGLHFGVESGSKKILLEYNKHISLSKARKVIQAVLKKDIEVKTHWIIGAPGETLETIRESIEYFVTLGIDPAIKYLAPLPGTPLFKVAVQKGRIKNMDKYLMIYTNWYDDKPVCNISNFSDDDLIKITHEAEAEIKARIGVSATKWSGIWRDVDSKSKSISP